MFSKLSLIGAALALGTSALVPAAPAAAQRYEQRDSRDEGRAYYARGDRQDRGYRDDRRYHSDRGYRNDRGYRGDRYQQRRRCDNGDGGTVIGAIAGGLIGNQVAGRGDRTVGTILGGALGALAGRSVDRSDRSDYCRR